MKEADFETLVESTVKLHALSETIAAWLSAVARTHGPQAVKELAAVVEELQVSRGKLEALELRLTRPAIKPAGRRLKR